MATIPVPAGQNPADAAVGDETSNRTGWQPPPGTLVAGIGGPLLLAVTNALTNFTPGWNAVETTDDALRVAADHAAITEAVAGIGMLSTILLVPAIWILAGGLARRAPILAGAGGWLMGAGYIAGTALSIETMIYLTVAGSGQDWSGFAAAIDSAATPLPLLATYWVFGLGALIGCVLLGVAMVRQRGAVPKWAGWAMIASPVVRMLGLILGIGFGPPLASLLITAAFAACLLRLRRAPA